MKARALVALGVFTFLFVVGAGASAQAADDDGQWPSAVGPHLEFAASFVHFEKGDAGAEAQFAGLWAPFRGHGLELGPRFGALRAWGPEQRSDFSIGAQGVLWVGGAIGPGAAVDWVQSTWNTGSSYRLEPFLTVRALRALDEGAVAFRLGFPYDSRYQWGIRLAVVLQLNGVASPGVAP